MSPASVRISVDGCRIATRPRREWAGEPDKPVDTVTVCLDSQVATLSTCPLFRLNIQPKLAPHLETSKMNRQTATVRQADLRCAWSAPISSPRPPPSCIACCPTPESAHTQTGRRPPARPPKAADGSQALIGHWKEEDGSAATELAGWRPDEKIFVTTGYGKNGSHWEVRFTTVTESMVEGPMVNRQPDGRLLKGTWQVTKKSEDEMPTLFVGTDDGEQVTVKGCFTRVK